MSDLETELKIARKRNIELTGDLIESLEQRHRLLNKLTLNYIITFVIVLVLSGIILTK